MNLGVDFGIFCTAQAVGRASLLSLVDNNVGSSIDENSSTNKSLIAICEDLPDGQEIQYSLEDVNEMAKSVLEIMTKLSDKEQNCTENDHDVKILYDISNINELDSDEEDDDKETRYHRFARAYLDALDSDSQGYITSTPIKEGVLSWKEMNAISWAAFSSSVIPSENETMRLHAFDQIRTIDRLKLASYWLADIFKEVEQESNSSR